MQHDKDGMHPEDRRNLILFIIAALLIWYGFDTLLLKPRMEAIRQAREATQQADKAGAAPDNIAVRPAVEETRERPAALAESQRLPIENRALTGSIALTGGRIDDLSLTGYYQTLKKRENVVLFSPPGTKHAKYVELGWMTASGETIAVPGPSTRWRVEGNGRPTPETPVTLAWDNGAGQRFERHISIDPYYLITVRQRIVNESGRPVTLFPYALASQKGLGDTSGSRIGLEGLIGYLDDELVERPFNKMRKDPEQTVKANDGWIAISQQYWFTGLIPPQEGVKTFRLLYTPAQEKREFGRFQVDYVGDGVRVAPGETAESVTRIYAGAKKLALIEHYEKELSLRHFDLAIDFGLWYFLTKPLFHTLDYLGGLTGNMGIAIIILTIIIRLAVFPLANTSYRSFAKMKQISPQMKELRELYGDDKTRLQQELVALYEREKVNPMSGCFPILIQIPIFFALYKVLSISIEMRHAPFFGWIQDLSERDPTSLFNLFGLIPWQPPEPLIIGIWPCIMLAAMLVQRQMNPPPQDPTQAMLVNVMPFMMTYILSRFAAGLVIYWTFSNILSVIQQYVIMRSMGVEVHFLRRSREDKEMEKMVREGPSVHPGLEVMEDEVEEALFGREETAPDEPARPISPPKRKRKKKK